MHVVINVPTELYERLMESNADDFDGFIEGELVDFIQNGTLLPEGHGRLGDLDKIKKEMQNYYDDCAATSEYTRLGFETAIAVVEDAKTLIEADKENKDAYSN